MTENDEGWLRAGEAVVAQRGFLGMSQKQLAANTRFNVSVIQDIELGRGAGRAPSTLAAVAREIGWEPDQIQRIAAGEDPPWRTDAERATALEAQVSALTEQITTLLAGLSRLAETVERLDHRVESLERRDG